MRNTVFGMNLSIDGCYDHTNFRADAEIFEYFTNLMHETDLIVYGRKTYQLMVPYWPDVAKAQSGTKPANEFAETLDAIEKVVVSRTLDSAQGCTRIIRDNAEGEIRKFKQQPGKKISVDGINLGSQLAALGLIDEFHFLVHPVIVGQGERFMEGAGLSQKLNLKLIDSKTFKSGAVALHYLKQ